MTAESPLLFVLGAGASKEVGLPLGGELREDIARRLDIRFEDFSDMISGDDRIANAFRLMAKASDGGYGNINPYLHASWRIRDAMPQAASIDNFLDAHASDKQLVYFGKVAIVRAILAAENQSSLHFNERNCETRIDFSRINVSWHNRFWQKLCEGCRANDLPDRISDCAFIIFNYDRCLEHFMHSAVQNYYNLSGDEAAQILSTLRIYHPYGKTGHLPWQGGNHTAAFGADMHSQYLNAFSGEIQTFTEGTDPNSSDITEIRSLMSSARTIVFLGFAFHRNNLEILFPTDMKPSERRQIDVYGTAQGISNSDLRVINIELSNGLNVPADRIHLKNDRSCYDLFGEFNRGISFL